MRFSIFAAKAFGAAVSVERREILADVVRTCTLRGGFWLPNLAAVYISVSARRRPAHSFQPSLSCDVRCGPRADLGLAEVLHLLLRMWGRRRNHYDHRETSHRPARSGQRFDTDNWSFRRDLWRPLGNCGRNAPPAGVGVSVTGNGVYARVCGGARRDRIFRDDWVER